MTTKDQIAIAKLYMESYSSETYRNTGHDSDRYDNPQHDKRVQRTKNLAQEIISGVFEYGNKFEHPQKVLKYANASIIDEQDDDSSTTTTIEIDIPYDIMGVEGDEAAEFISQQLRMRDSSGYGGGKYASADVINVEPSENGEGWARFTIEYTKGYDV